MPETVTVYFDYLCPFAWRGAEVAEVITKELGLDFEWRHFSLYQSNHDQNDGWQLWNDRLDHHSENGCKGLLPFLASCAARKQGADRFHLFRLELLRARHRDHQPCNLQTITQVAEAVGLHLPKFESDLADPECRTVLAHEHYRAKALDVFGTPTFHFETGHLAYFRIKALPKDDEEAIVLFQAYRDLLERFPYLETVKRPRSKGN